AGARPARGPRPASRRPARRRRSRRAGRGYGGADPRPRAQAALGRRPLGLEVPRPRPAPRPPGRRRDDGGARRGTSVPRRRLGQPCAAGGGRVPLGESRHRPAPARRRAVLHAPPPRARRHPGPPRPARPWPIRLQRLDPRAGGGGDHRRYVRRRLGHPGRRALSHPEPARRPHHDQLAHAGRGPARGGGPGRDARRARTHAGGVAAPLSFRYSGGPHMRVAVVLLLAVLPVRSVAAQDSPRPTLALVGGQVIDGYEGPPIQDGVVLIAGDRIVAVGPRSAVTVPPGTTIIDTEGMSVLPGLMDMHVHLMLIGHADYEHWDKTYMP